MKNNLTIISDDITGCVDSGAIFSCSKCNIKVSVKSVGKIEPHQKMQVLSFNMSSRTLTGENARHVHKNLAEQIKLLPNQVIMKKMDTGFRGNAPYEIEGIFEGTGKKYCFMLSHSPVRQVFTLYGRQYVGGIILNESLVAKEDPLKKPVKSFIPEILSAETSLPVGLVDIDIVKGGNIAEEVKKTIDQGYKIIVFDVITRADGFRIINSLHPLFPDAIWAGSSGLAWGLSKYFYGDPEEPKLKKINNERCVCFTASAYKVTKNQIEKAKILTGLRKVYLNVARYAQGDFSVIDEIVRQCMKVNQQGDFILIPVVPKKHSFPNMSQIILNAISISARLICEKARFNRLVVIGGETAQSILSSLEVNTLSVTEKLEDGFGVGVLEDGPWKGKRFSFKGGVCGSLYGVCKMLGKYEEL